MLCIRQIGDPILHRKTHHVSFSKKEHVGQLKNALHIMEKNLHTFNGIGIASNQCQHIADPMQAFIMGTNLMCGQSRYPGHEIPAEKIMINPCILNLATPYYPNTGEGCLSVKGSMRARILRYESVTVEYEDVNGKKHTDTFTGLAAHIIQHEYDHLNGVVFLQKAIEELTKDQAALFLKAITESSQFLARENQVPLLIIDRDSDNKIKFIPENLAMSIAETSPVALEGIKRLLMRQIQ